MEMGMMRTSSTGTRSKIDRNNIKEGDSRSKIPRYQQTNITNNECMPLAIDSDSPTTDNCMSLNFIIDDDVTDDMSCNTNGSGM